MIDPQPQGEPKDWKAAKADLFPPGAPPAEEPPSGKSPGTVVHDLTPVSAGAEPTSHASWFVPNRDKAPENRNVHNPEHAGNRVVPLPSSATVFEKVAEAIEKAEESIDILTMGIDTDIHLTRKDWRDSGNLEYIQAFPAEPADRLGNSGEAPPVDADGTSRDSTILADMLTRAALGVHPRTGLPREGGEKKITVRILAGAPRLLGNSFCDPLHFWWRCKTGNYGIRFALREAKGEYHAPPPATEPDMTDWSITQILHYKLTKALDGLANFVFRLASPAYQYAFTHHQKLVLIDAGKPNARAFVIGSNMNENYWDTTAHEIHGLSGDDKEPMDKRYYMGPRGQYGPWRDVGLSVQGPVIHDIAKNFEECWALLKDQEALPEHLITDAKAAARRGMFLNEGNAGAGFDHRRFSRILAALPALIGAAGLKVHPSLSLLLTCGIMTGLIDLMGGLISGALDGSKAVRKETPEWGGAYLKPEEYKPDEELPTVMAQFTRTFAQKGTGSEPDFSARIGIYHAAREVKNGGLVYVENQYFRDLGLVDVFDEIIKGKVEPYVIIVMTDAGFSGFESLVAKGPTFVTYKRMKKVFKKKGKVLYCCLRTPENPPKPFAAARYDTTTSSHKMDILLRMLKLIGLGAPLALVLLNTKFRSMRNLLLAALPAVLAKAGGGLAGAAAAPPSGAAGPAPGTPSAAHAGPAGAAGGASGRAARAAPDFADPPPEIADLAPVINDMNRLTDLMLDAENKDNPLMVLIRELGENPDRKDEIVPKIIDLLEGRAPAEDGAEAGAKTNGQGQAPGAPAGRAVKPGRPAPGKDIPPEYRDALESFIDTDPRAADVWRLLNVYWRQ